MRQLIHLVDHDNLESLLLPLVELHASSHLLYQLLHDDTIVHLGIGRGHLDVVHGREDRG